MAVIRNSEVAALQGFEVYDRMLVRSGPEAFGCYMYVCKMLAIVQGWQLIKRSTCVCAHVCIYCLCILMCVCVCVHTYVHDMNYAYVHVYVQGFSWNKN